MYKQILSIKEKFNQDEIEDDYDAIRVLNEFVSENQKSQILSNNMMSEIFDEKIVDLSGVFIKHTAINTISRKWFGGNYIKFELNLLTSKPKKDGSYKLDHFISLEFIKQALLANLPIEPDIVFSDSKKIKKKEVKVVDNKLEPKSVFSDTFSEIINNNQDLWINFLKIWKHEWSEICNQYEENLRQILPLLSKQKLIKNSKGSDEKTESNIIKNFADASLKKYQMMKYFALEEGKKKVEIDDVDVEFYNQYNEYYLNDKIVDYYNRFRNYITKKPYNVEDKLKLNFNNPTLLAGWDLNKESTNWSFILRKENKYYLVVTSEGNNQLFDQAKNPELFKVGEDQESYEKMEYKLLSGPNKMLPKCLIPKSDRAKYGATQEILDIYDKGSFKKGGNFEHEDCIKLIDFYKQALEKYTDWNVFNFTFKESKEYEDISKFYHDVEKQGFKLNFNNINSSLIDKYVEDGYMYQFQIYNKDFKEYAKGSKNLHTLYWEALFSKKNLKNIVIKLNGEAEVFLRPAQPNVVKTSRIINGKFKQEITEKARYLKEKMFFHIPITLNFAKNDEKINIKINRLIQEKPVNIIGIDRGEKHLAYYCVIDQNGNIKEVESLNTIHKKPYHAILTDREDKRNIARENWESIEKIKDLKEGYISQVVNKITDLMLEHNAIVVFEDLNSGFKNSRKKIEKSIYQKLETALASKLGYLVKKSENNIINAYQLVPKISNYSDIENQKQVGVMLFTTASYTSTTCPNCGFRKRLYLKPEGDIKNKLCEVDFNHENDTFILKYDSKSKNDLVIHDTIYCKKGDKRIINIKNDLGEWQPTTIKIYEKVLTWFGGISQMTNDLNLQILESSFEQKKYKELIGLFNNLVQLRNSDSKNHIDYISCPSCGYNSDRKDISDKNIDKIQDADANGAYNIARKGLMMVNNIKKSEDLTLLSYADLFISDSDWDKFVSK